MLSNLDRTDLEMLHIIAEASDGDGIAASADIADVLGIGRKNGTSPAGRVAPRMSWMCRLRFVERVSATERPDAKSALWRITEAGRRLMNGKLSATVASAIERDDPGSQLLMMRRLTQRTLVRGDGVTAAALRREYEHNRAQRLP
jgi:hypothetical protein